MNRRSFIAGVTAVAAAPLVGKVPVGETVRPVAVTCSTGSYIIGCDMAHKPFSIPYWIIYGKDADGRWAPLDPQPDYTPKLSDPTHWTYEGAG